MQLLYGRIVRQLFLWSCYRVHRGKFPIVIWEKICYTDITAFLQQFKELAHQSLVD